MAGDKEVVEQLAKLRLKILKEKIQVEKQKAPAKLRDSAPGVTTDPRVMLQAEILKSEQLLQNVKEERYFLKSRTKKNQDTEEWKSTSISKETKDMNAEMVSMMLAQSVQLQQMMINQLTSNPYRNTSTEPVKTEPVKRQVEIEPVGYREMDPFTSLPQTQPTIKVKPVHKERKLPLPPKPNHKVRASSTRMIAMPVRSTELVREPKPRSKTSASAVAGFLNEPSTHNPNNDAYPFPGTKRIRKLRHVFYVAWFCVILISSLKKIIKRRYEAVQRLDNYIQSGIYELHKKYYMNPDNSILMALNDLIKDGCLDINVRSPGIFQKLSRDQQAALTELSTVVETLIHSITEIRPMSGLVSPSREGVLWYLLQPGVHLPASYLWQVEKDRIQFTENGAVASIDKQTGIMLVIGFFISRGLVSSILFRPVESGLSTEIPSNIAQSNLKVLSSILMKIVRDVSVAPKSKAMGLASEITTHLYSDDEMKFLYKKLDGTLIWSKANLRKFASGFVDMVNKS